MLEHLHKSQQRMGVALPTAAMTRPTAQVTQRTLVGHFFDRHALSLEPYAEVRNEAQVPASGLRRVSLLNEQALKRRNVLDQRSLRCEERVQPHLPHHLLHGLGPQASVAQINRDYADLFLFPALKLAVARHNADIVKGAAYFLNFECRITNPSGLISL